MLFTDLREMKSVLEIDPCNTEEDKKLSFLNEWVSAWLEEWLGRPGMTYKARTEYYAGTGTQVLCLNSRPVYTTPTIQVFVDPSGYYGQPDGAFDSTTELTYGTDFCLKAERDDGLGYGGLLVRINDYWTRPTVRSAGLLSPYIGPAFGNVKVVYTAGYTVDTFPAQLRMAANILVARLRYLLPLGMELTSESYEERAIAIAAERKDYLMGLVKPMLFNSRNWKF